MCPAKDGALVVDMQDEVIRGATVVKEGVITWPPPAPKLSAAPTKPSAPAAAAKPPTAPKKSSGVGTAVAMGVGALALAALGETAPASFMPHFIVFVLSCFIGFSVIWNVSHSLHTPLMAVTNAISGIVILGALLQIGSSNWLVVILASLSVLIASINIVGGFLVTRRMLAMFQKS
jgi:NAD(P) transhydrogenase subunit alpha